MLTRLVRKLFRPGNDAKHAAIDNAATVGADEKNSGAACEELLEQADTAVKAGRLQNALEFYSACMQTYPQSLDACLGAASVLVDLWSIKEVVDAYERALKIAPASIAIFSAWLFYRHYLSPVDAQTMFELHQRYGCMMETAWPPSHQRYASAPDPKRRLRIGYLSPNLSRHSVGYFIEPVIRCHDRSDFEVFCYYAHPLADDATHRMRELADDWRAAANSDDAALAQMVRDDRIDILIDLAGHSKGNRLGVFARRPAPVQLTWLGYPDTTGLPAIDYRITDSMADPAPAAAINTETLLRIDDCFVCYQPPADAPSVTLREAGSVVVFASFNNIAKVNAQIIAWWAEILAGVPDSRLAIKSSSLNFPDTVDRVLDSFERAGIDPARIDLRGWIDARRQHLDAYGEIDIALDTFPYNGTTTTCEALWMGVPVVTCMGEVHMSRVGASLLHCSGLDRFIARDANAYVRIAIDLAHDEHLRRSLRAELRPRLRASPLLDHAGFTRKFEAHCRDAWHAWCERQPVA